METGSTTKRVSDPRGEDGSNKKQQFFDQSWCMYSVCTTDRDEGYEW